jgi:energy-coupling factor transporter ATP-binding protein EcfA2
MPSGSYERFGLTGNPFRELASENLEDVTIYHVNQESDALLRSIRDEVFDKENRAVVAITGPQGSGKTQRLLVTAAEARDRQAFSVYFDVPTKGALVLRGLAAAFEKSARTAGLVKLLGAPAWLRSVSALARVKAESFDPKDAGRRIGAALNATAPSFLLLNDLHNLVDSSEIDLVAKTLEEVSGAIKPGVLVLFTCYASYLAWLTANQPSFAARINRAIPLATLSDDEARLVLAKKLLAKRVVEDLEPTYPFDRDAVHELNRASHGNARRLFELADTVLEGAVAARVYQIDSEAVRGALLERTTSAPHAPPAWQETTDDPVPSPRVPAAPAAPARRSLWGRSRER